MILHLSPDAAAAEFNSGQDNADCLVLVDKVGSRELYDRPEDVSTSSVVEDPAMTQTPATWTYGALPAQECLSLMLTNIPAIA